MKPLPRFLWLFLFACLPLSASSEERPREDVPTIQQLNGYTVRILRLERDSYGYEIRRGATVLVHQRRNPFSGSEMGLARKEDALKTATWLLENVVMKEQMRPRGRRLPETSTFSRSIPISVAATLGVTVAR